VIACGCEKAKGKPALAVIYWASRGIEARAEGGKWGNHRFWVYV
jgi:hypothetical protein